MTTVTVKVNVQKCDNGNLIRTWFEDTELHVQLTTPTCAEIAHATFTGGRYAADMADLVSTTWWFANAA